MSSGLTIGLIVLLAILIIFSAFFSAAETAYSSVSKSKIANEAKKGKRSALLISKHYNSFGWTLATILICNNLVNISASALITFLFTKLLGATGTVTIISTFVMTPIIVIFGEITPKLLAKKHSYSYLKKIAFIMEAFNIILFPITFPLSKIALQSKVTNSETELKGLINLAKKEGVLDNNEATLARKALDLDSTTVSKVMTKRNKVIFIQKGASVSAALSLFKKHGLSRIPVKSEEGFIGLILLKDVFLAGGRETIDKYIIEISSVSQHALATRALETMRMMNSHLALVCDKQDSKRVVGIITIEDIIEELVGEIYDEHDKRETIREIAHYKWTVIGSASVEKLQNELGIELEIDEDNLTVKQWLQSRINRKIKAGLRYIYKDTIVFKIISNKNNEETIIEVNKK